MKAEYISHMGTDLSAVNAARVSLDKESAWEYFDIEGKPEADSDNGYVYRKLNERDAKLVSYLAKHKHFSCFEHQAVTLRLKVPLFIARQIQRHRTFSYNEISRRYVKDNLEFYWPDKWRQAAENVKQGSTNNEIGGIWYPKKSIAPEGEQKIFSMKDMQSTWELYLRHQYEVLLENGICPEQARMILPQNLYTSFYMTGNLRNWTHFLKLRLDGHAQREAQEIAQQCAEIIEPLFPVSFSALMNADD